MPLPNENAGCRAQIALEFIILYSFVLVVFVLMFALVASQRAATLAQQEYSILQLQAQNAASYIDQALGAGNGYSATIPFAGGINAQPYNLSVSTSGVIIAQMKIGTQIIRAYAFSNARNLIINGTPIQTGNGITVYLVPIQSGSLYIANSNGAIYIDAPPASTLGLAKSITLTSIANTKAASFNGVSSYIRTGTTGLPTGSAARSVFAWVYFTGGTGFYTVHAYGGGATGWTTQGDGSAFGINNGKVYFAGYSDDGSSSLAVSANVWHQIGYTYNAGSTQITLYLDNQLPQTVTLTTGVLNTVIPSSDPSDLGKLDGGANNDLFPGSITNLQIYNTALSASQIVGLYSEGISGVPTVPANIVGWWLLNGGANDYGGNNNNGVPTNVVYQSVAQINAQVKAGNGANAISTPMGFVTSNGMLVSNGNSLVLYTNAAGSNTVFVSSNGVKGIANLTINTFNDNITTAGNLVGWWPLDEGYGSIAYDFSGQYYNGAFNSPSWTPFVNQTNLAVAGFNGVSSYISTGTTGLPTVNNQRTVAAWINPSSGVSGNDAFYFYGTNSANPNGYGAYVTSAYKIEVEFDSGNGAVISNKVLSPNTWYFVAATYSGSTSTVYINGVPDNSISYSSANTLVGTSDIGVWGSLANWFSGSIANLQVYSTALPPPQVMQLYQEGISGSPIGDSGLVGWWPLAYSANDYSSAGNNGAPTNVIFSSVQYTNTPANNAVRVAGFNGVSGYVSLPPMTVSNSITFSGLVYYTSDTGSNEVIFSDNAITPFITASTHMLNVNFNWGDNSHTYYTSNVAITLDAWHSVTMVYDGSNIRSWVDGTAGAVTPVSGSKTFGGPYTAYIGRAYSGGLFWSGNLANIQLYNTALTSTQAQQIYQQGLPMYSELNVSLG